MIIVKINYYSGHTTNGRGHTHYGATHFMFYFMESEFKEINLYIMTQLESYNDKKLKIY